MGTTIFLSRHPKVEWHHDVVLFSNPMFAHTAFRVEDLDDFLAFYHEVKDKGVPIKFTFNHGVVNLYAAISEREREVLHLIARGLKNAEIAKQLFISERMVKSHINNILSKLHVADRTQAAIYAWHEGFTGK